MYTHLLVATDLSEQTDGTISKAAAVAKKLDAKLSLVHIIEPMYYHGYPYVAEFEAALMDHAKKELEAFGTKYGVKKEDLHIMNGVVKTAVPELAEEIHADVIILGSHGHNGLSRLLGSSASAVLHHAHRDVLVMRSEA